MSTREAVHQDGARSAIRRVVGCMTGSSIDGLDAALVEVRGRGLQMTCQFIRGVSRDLGSLAPPLRALADQKPMTARDIATVMRDFALLHAAAIRDLMAEDGPPALVSVHGQTVFHSPPLSWQMFNASVLAHEVGSPVVFDLRAADLAAGGQGAPITPLADWVLFRSARPTAVVNLGGFCNATVLPGSPATCKSDEVAAIRGFDVCACNHLLDRIARMCFQSNYDEGGRHAASGTPTPAAMDSLCRVLSAQSGERRSLGTSDECAAWVDAWVGKSTGEDLAATACSAIARTLAAQLEGVDRVLIAGGGARNAELVRALERATGRPVEPTSVSGIPIEIREAAEMAVLGALCQDRVPITLPRVTGVANPAPIAGVWAGA